VQLVTTHSGQEKRHGSPKRAQSRSNSSARNRTTRSAPVRQGLGQTVSASLRTCIGCRVTAPKADLVRMVDGPDGQIVFDLSGRALGRGAWTHPSEACLKRTAKALRGMARATGPGRNTSATNSSVSMSPDASPPEHGVLWSELVSALSDAATRRARGLFSSAYRGGYLALGTDASTAEFAEGRARLVLLASDAAAASKEPWLETAVNHGKVVVWSTKSELGALVGRNELAVCVVTNDGLASSLVNVLALTTPVTSRLAGATLAVARSQITTMATGSHGLEDSEDG
jgi:predicted RNA-binding protein YlxR (DUF448 family)/ribosomal protein L7Ae-like RNA K-turn-binding protein